MREIFVDTGAWVALMVQDDTYHQEAQRVYREVLQPHSRLVTTNLVIAETYILLRKAAGHAPAVAFLEMIAASPRIERIFATAEHEAEAVTLLKKYRDQDFSLTDAVSFVVMKHRKIKRALAFDQHFRVAGFELVP
ncbi:MAG: PIN domain-containing protein [Candidatus Bipolaricaulota bacterium]|nr:PIN domain-containing protein [Candidatus Bipolaricaulota bacterium]